MAQCLRPITVKAPGQGFRPRLKYITVPCNRCPECLKKRQQDWAIRMEQETVDCESKGGCCYFTTLTYEDSNLPYFEDDGSISLYKRDAQKFIETLKRRIKWRYGKDTNVRYFCCGEYGDKVGRPHYHFMLWFPFQITSYELRPILEDVWTNGIILGIHPFSIQLAEYVAKYSTKQYGIDYGGIQQPFALMSLKPAIGSSWIERNRDFYLLNPHPFMTDRHGVRFSLPRYYRNRVYDLNVYQNYVDACIKQHDLDLECKLQYYGNQYFRDTRQANERFIELFWQNLKSNTNVF